MKPRDKSILSILLIVLFLALAGCVSTHQKFQDDMMAQGIKPLTGPEVQKLYSNVTEYSKNPRYEYEGFYSADGKIKAKAWGSWGEEKDVGEWRVTSDGYRCEQYFGKWSKSGERCYAVYPGKTSADYTLVSMTGSQSKGWPSGIIPVKLTPGM